jgi:hypothetical protein
MPKLSIGDYFRLFTKDEATPAPYLLISAHGRRVDVSIDAGCTVHATAPKGSVVWMLAPPNSSIRQEPYAEIMQKAAVLILGDKRHYDVAQQYTNTQVPNMMLSKFKEKEPESESNRIRQVVSGQKVILWDVLTVRPEKSGWRNLGRRRPGLVSLASAFKAVDEFCEQRRHVYSMIACHFCGIAVGERDDQFIYDAGFRQGVGKPFQ